MTEKIGSKSQNLEILVQNGFQVPTFLFLTCTDVVQIVQNLFNWDDFFLTLKQSGIRGSFAVRSSAFSEDSEASSEAGKYMTFLDVKLDRVQESIIEVIEHYKKVQNTNDVSGFSLIIQEYKESDISGVTFTRSPDHQRNMYIEYVSGRGDHLVGGESIPQVGRAHYGGKRDCSLPNVDTYIETWWAIETLFNFSMDIEWCIAHGELWILQARPITTISRQEFESFRFLDGILKGQEEYSYSTGIETEMTPTPTPFTLSVLRMIQGEGGPVEGFYRRHHIFYRDPECLCLFGNQLYIDRIREKGQFSGGSWWNHIVNKISFLTLKPEGRDKLRKEIERMKEKTLDTLTFHELFENFMEDYRVIYSINFSAGVYQNIAKKLKLNPSIKNPQIESNGLIGNSLEIADESKWKTFSSDGHSESETGIYSELSQKIGEYLTFREIGRSIVVRYITFMRIALQEIARKNTISDYRDLYFLTVDEVLKGIIDERIIQSRKTTFEQSKKYIFPSVISSEFLDKQKSGEIIWASGEVLQGALVSLDQIENYSGPIILYTRFLSPDIVESFERIDGIISENGGTLSHLALVARERGIPVVIDEKVLEKYSIGDILSYKR